MPNFKGERARKFWCAVATKAAIECVLTTQQWPDDHWSMQRVVKAVLYITGSIEFTGDLEVMYYDLHRYIAAEEASDRMSLFRKLMPW